MGHLSSSSSVASDDSDGDVGFLTSLPGLSSFGSMQRASVSSDFSFCSAVDRPTRLPQAGSGTPVPRWHLAREGPFLSELPLLDVGGIRPGMCLSQYYPQAVTPPPVSAPRSWLDYWIKALAPRCTRCPGNKPLMLPDSFTGTYVL